MIKQRYIESKQNSWSPSTIKSERARLASIPDKYLPDDPKGFHAHCLTVGMKPYTIKTLFIRAGELVSFGWPSTPNKYKQFMQANAKLFKHAYQPRRPGLTFQEAVASIKAKLPEAEACMALSLLASGLRISEANCVVNGTVIGKGGRPRQVANAPKVYIDTHKLRVALKRINLTPHMLRKLAATHAVEVGAREADLLAIFGWRSAQTASYYVQETRAREVASKLMEDVYND